MAKVKKRVVVLPPLKIVRAIGLPNKRLLQDLADVSHECLKMRNGISLAWRMWADGHEFTPGESKIAPAPAKEDKSAYIRTTEISPHVSTGIANSICQAFLKSLNSKVAYNRKAKAKYKWESILLGEESLISYRDDSIPIETKGQRITWDSCFKVSVPLWSKKAGRKSMRVSFELAIGALTKGYKQQIKKAVDGEEGFALKAATIYRHKDQWYMRFAAELPPVEYEPAVGTVAYVVPGKADELWPFYLEGERDGKSFRYGCGFGKPLVAEKTRIEQRRKHIGFNRKRGRKVGHGTDHYFAESRRLARRLRCVFDDFRHRLVHRIVQKAKEHDIETIVFEEPSINYRKRLWLGHRGVEIDWTRLATDIKAKCEGEGLKYANARKEKAARRARVS